MAKVAVTARTSRGRHSPRRIAAGSCTASIISSSARAVVIMPSEELGGAEPLHAAANAFGADALHRLRAPSGTSGISALGSAWATEPQTVPRLRVCAWPTQGMRLGEQRLQLRQVRPRQQRGLPDTGTDDQRSALRPHRIEVGNAHDIDYDDRPGEAHVEHRHQATARRRGCGHRRRARRAHRVLRRATVGAEIVERRRLHRAPHNRRSQRASHPLRRRGLRRRLPTCKRLRRTARSRRGPRRRASASADRARPCRRSQRRSVGEPRAAPCLWRQRDAARAACRRPSARPRRSAKRHRMAAGRDRTARRRRGSAPSPGRRRA